MDSIQSTYTHTPDHIGCPACEQFGAMRLLDVSLPFSAAVEIWMRNHSVYIKPSSLRVYGQHQKRLTEFLQNIPIGQINIGHIRGYQAWRREHACPEMINAEIANVLAPILAEIQQWQFFVKVYRPLPVPPRIVRQSLSEEQLRRLEKHPVVTVNEGLKNDYRMRTIPLNWIALRSMRWILHRWEGLGGETQEQYILPHHARHTPEERDPARKRSKPPLFDEPMGHIWNAARKILNEAGLESFDPYDMRSHFATKLLENPDVSDQQFEELFGHRPDSKTRRRYSRQRIEKKVVIVEKVAIDPEPQVRLVMFPGGRK